MKKKMVNNSLNWILFDAENQILGRFASKIAIKLMGKDNINYESNRVFGVKIVVINSKKIIFSGDKLNKKRYYRHTGYPGGLKMNILSDLLKTNPNFILRTAIKGMLPKNRLQKIFLRNLKIYENNIHPHLGQIFYK